METIRERNLKAGLPYIRQVVTYNGKTHTVMVYDHCTITNVQLAPGIHESAVLWNTAKHEWVEYRRCRMSAEDAEFVNTWRANAQAAQEGIQAPAKAPAELTKARKPMPKPSRPHKATNRPSRQKVKANLRKEKR